MSTFCIQTKELPFCVRLCLRQIEYNRPFINIRAAADVCVQDRGATGQRAYAFIINLETEQSELIQGSWGGPNIFNPKNQVDNDSKRYTIPLNGAVILGSAGSHHVATLYMHQDNISSKYLPPAIDLSDDEKTVIRTVASLKSEYRKAILSKIASSVTDGLVERGLLLRNKRDALKLSTAGRNAYLSMGR